MTHRRVRCGEVVFVVMWSWGSSFGMRRAYESFVTYTSYTTVDGSEILLTS